MNFRPATTSDAAGVSALIGSFLLEYTVDPTGAGAEEFLATVSEEAERGYIASPNIEFLVAEEGSTLAGFIAIRDHSHVFHLFVDRRFQGRGLARELWERARSRALEAGGDGAFTVNSSPRAVPVYGRFGFVESGSRIEKHGIAVFPMRLEASKD
ncbi:MAG TPA: GNAT family N-acetyltransferase [Thermoanaerobaculia bacterium]|nr:GNAT family N-acetyltransferase [Thermoanaerobaculia bacterium]